MADWNAFYTSRRRFTSDDHEWADLPDDGILGVIEWAGVQRHAIYGFDWYFHQPETGLIGGNDDDPEEIVARYPGAVLKRGMWLPYDEWLKIRRLLQRYDD